MIAADQMIRNLSMKIGEVDSGSARLLATHNFPIFMLKFLIIWSLLKGVKFVIGPSLALLAKDTFLLSSDIWHLCWLLAIGSFSN